MERDPSRALTTALDDGYEVNWLYGPTDALAPDPGGLPGADPFVRGTRVGTPWAIRQPNAAGSRPQANAEILADLVGGATEVLLTASLDGRRGVAVADLDELSEVLAGVQLELAPIALDAGPDAPRLGSLLLELWRREGGPAAEIRGALRIDPLGVSARTGLTDVAQTRAQTDAAVRTVAEVRTEFPHVRVLAVDTAPYVEAGAGATLELAAALATGIAYLRAAEAAGMPPGRLAGALEFTLVVGADQFLEIAKLRAFRRLWATVLQHCGVPPAGRQSSLYAATSRRMLSTLDPSINILRATTAAFAAGVGGADGVTVLPFDEPLPGGLGASGDLARRVARNTQLVLLEEASLHRVADPGGGAWYVESLTDDLARRAWALMQELERSGGIAEAIASGALASRIDGAAHTQRDRLARRRRLLTGVNAFPFLDEDRPAVVLASAADASGALTPVRDGAQFEALRGRAATLTALNRRRPTVLLACSGPPASHQAQAAWARSFLEVGGILTVASAGGVWRELMAEHDLRVAVICGGAEPRAAGLTELVAALRVSGARAVYVAGAGLETATGLGADAGLRDGEDMVTVLSALLDRFDGATA